MFQQKNDLSDKPATKSHIFRTCISILHYTKGPTVNTSTPLARLNISPGPWEMNAFLCVRFKMHLPGDRGYIFHGHLLHENRNDQEETLDVNYLLHSVR